MKGLGYVHVDNLPLDRLETYAKSTATLMERSNMKILNLIGQRSVPKLALVEAFARQPQIEAIFW